MEMDYISPWAILIGALFTGNILLSYFLGMCSFLACSKQINTSLGLGAAVIFVMTCTTAINYGVYYGVLKPMGLDFLSFIVFIAVIAAFVQFVEMFIERFSQGLYHALGIFLPLITVNCAILGGALFSIIREYDFIQTLMFGFASGLGWALAILLMAGLRKKMGYSKVPAAFEGVSIVMIITGLMAMAFIGFSGMVRIQ